jgi:hypothetical protein
LLVGIFFSFFSAKVRWGSERNVRHGDFLAILFANIWLFLEEQQIQANT